MGKNLIHIEQSDLKRLNMNMKEFEKELKLVCKEALKNVGALIEADAKTNLSKNNSMASNKLINSVGVKESRSQEVKVGTPMKYAYFVEYGRKAGGKPPYYSILQWIKDKKMEPDDKKARAFAGAVMNHIKIFGTRPHPFLRPAYEKNKPSLVKVLKAGSAKIFNKDYSKR